MIEIHSLAGQRGKAYARDCLGYLGIAGATVPFGIIALKAGWGNQRAFVLTASALPPLVATVVAAARESSPLAATPGKRRYGLLVKTNKGQKLPFGRALLRNAVKIGLPWQAGHTIAVGAAFGGFDEMDPLTVGATVVTYPLVAAMLASVALREGRSIHDRIARSKVLPAHGSQV